VFEGDFVGGVITSSTQGEAEKPASTPPPFPVDHRGCELECCRDRAATCSSPSVTPPAIEAFVKFLARPLRRPTAWGQARRLSATGNKNVPASILPGRDHPCHGGADRARPSRVVFDMVRRAAGVVRCTTTGQGRVGHLPAVSLKAPSNVSGIQKKLEAGRNRGVQEGQVRR